MTTQINLLVEFEAKHSLLDNITLKYKIEDLTVRKVDVVTPAGTSHYLVEQIIKEAVPLW